jgi:hypothetical protein
MSIDIDKSMQYDIEKEYSISMQIQRIDILYNFLVA